MNNRKKIKEAACTIAFMVVMTAVCVGVVSVIYQHSKVRIDLNQEMFIRKAVLQAAGVLPEKADAAKVSEVFQAEVKDVGEGKNKYYKVNNGNYVFPVTGTGLWGKIDAVVGLDKSLKTITGISFTDNNETPGLGARITEPWFCNQFRNKKGPVSFVPEGTKNESANEFDAITGATITTRAVKDMVNVVFKEAPERIGGGGK